MYRLEARTLTPTRTEDRIVGINNMLLEAASDEKRGRRQRLCLQDDGGEALTEFTACATRHRAKKKKYYMAGTAQFPRPLVDP